MEFDSYRPEIPYGDELPMDSQIHPKPSVEDTPEKAKPRERKVKKEKKKPAAKHREKKPAEKVERQPGMTIGERLSAFRAALTGTSARIIAGIFFGCLSIYLGVAFVSYFVTCIQDQSAINSEAIGAAQNIANSAGEGGARLAEFLINETFGLGSFVIVLWLGAIALKLLVGQPRFKTVNFSIKCLVALITVSLIVGLTTITLHSPVNWGGFHGRYVNEFIMHMVGGIGALLLCIFMISIFVIICLSDLIRWIIKMKKKRDEKRRILAEKRAEEEARQEALRRSREEQKIEDLQAGESVNLAPEESEIQPSDYDTSVSFGDESLYNIEPTESTPAEQPSYPYEGGHDEIESSDEKTRGLQLKSPGEETPAETVATSVPQEVLTAPQAIAPSAETNIDGMATVSTSASMPDTLTPHESGGDVGETPSSPSDTSSVVGEAATEEKREGEDVMVVTVNQIDQVSKPHYRVGDTPADNRPYRFPPFELLREGVEMIPVDVEEQKANKEKIQNTLMDFGIPITRIEATVGPTVTLYEIVPDKGVKIAKIRSLADDIALRIFSESGVRIIAPIPGKGTVGIEVPNRDKQVVSMRTVIKSKKFQDNKYLLPVALGSTISNDVYITDLSKMPHLLVAGATGQGKSVGLNAIIASLLYSKKPGDLKFVMIDPKQVEFSLYNKIKDHYMAAIPSTDDDNEPVITDMKKVEATLNSLCVEMDNRYTLLKNAYTRNIEEYNNKFKEGKLNPQDGHRFLPYIVIVVDEFGDLIMVSGKNVELPIARLAQKARAVGMHVIIATQRPSTNVITGIIKANFPARISFKVSSGVDSKTILDTTGAQQLIGRGDMLIFNNSEMVRVQCAFIDTPEVEAICDYIEQQPYPTGIYELPEPMMEDGEPAAQAGANIGDRDSLFDDAARLVVHSGVASASMLQRKLGIGYARAGKLIDQLEAAGIVGPSQGGKPRAVLVDPAALEDILGQV